MTSRRLTIIAIVLAVVAPLAAVASAHEEREVTEPGAQAVPEYRDTGPAVVVCKPDSLQRSGALPAELRQRNLALATECRFEHIQEAVNWVAADGQPGTRILVLPGVYREEPSQRSRELNHGAPLDRPDLADDCARIWEETNGGDDALDYGQQVTCPHIQNLIAVHGDGTPGDDTITCDTNLCDLQIEGTGGRPEDVVIDGMFEGMLNGIHGDRADGLYLKNLSAQHFEFNGFYVIQTAGATLDETVGRFNHEYGFLSFQAFVRYQNCGGHGNGDSVIYPGASPNVLDGQGLIPLHRDGMTFSTEVRGCRGHHSALGYSGTTGNAVWIHHNEFDHNSTGHAQDSLFPGHPGTPQNHALLEDNLFHENNVNYYDQTAHRGVCSQPLDERDYDDGAVCPAIPLPVGTGQITAGGNFNWFHGNRFYDNWRQGAYLIWIPAEVREGEPDPDAHFRDGCGPDGTQTCPYEETSHWNTYSGNRMADEPLHGFVQPNGVDFTWDAEGQGNCWAAADGGGYAANTSAAGEPTYRIVENETTPPAPFFPPCTDRDVYFAPVVSSPLSTIPAEAGCANYNVEDEPDPAGCDWFHTPPVPADRQPERPTLQRVAGDHRIDTAIAASREGFPTDAPTVTLARHDLYPDALAGAPLAHARGGPMLLTPSHGVDPRVAEEISRLGATTVILLGGTDALGTQVETDLRALGFGPDDIVRIGGANRYETAANIAGSLTATDAFLAKGEAPDDQGWPDALAVSPVAALLGRPILLTAPADLPAATDAALADGSIEAIDIVGGVEAVSAEVEQAVAARVDEVERVAGEDRFETSLEVARFALKAGADPTELWLTTAGNWPDGIAAGSAIAVDEGIMLLVGDAIGGDGPVAAWLEGEHPYFDAESDDSVADVLERVRVLGGPDAIPAAVDGQLEDRYGTQRGDAVGDRSGGNRTWIGRLSGGSVSGTARVTTTLVGSTRTWIHARGLEARHQFEAHLVSGSCASPGDDLTFPDGHQMHVTFSSDGTGAAVADGTVFRHPDDGPGALVIHHHDTTVACADL